MSGANRKVGGALFADITAGWIEFRFTFNLPVESDAQAALRQMSDGPETRRVSKLSCFSDMSKLVIHQRILAVSRICSQVPDMRTCMSPLIMSSSFNTPKMHGLSGQDKNQKGAAGSSCLPKKCPPEPPSGPSELLLNGSWADSNRKLLREKLSRRRHFSSQSFERLGKFL